MKSMDHRDHQIVLWNAASTSEMVLEVSLCLKIIFATNNFRTRKFLIFDIEDDDEEHRWVREELVVRATKIDGQ